MSLTYDALFIGGGWVQSAGATPITVVSASTEEVLGQVPEATRSDVDAAVGVNTAVADTEAGPPIKPVLIY